MRVGKLLALGFFNFSRLTSFGKGHLNVNSQDLCVLAHHNYCDVTVVEQSCNSCT